MYVIYINNYLKGVTNMSVKSKTFYVYKDKSLLFEGSENDCFEFLLRYQGNSVSHACKYEGYEITDINSHSLSRFFAF